MIRKKSIALCGFALASLSLSGVAFAEEVPADEPNVIFYQIEGSASCNNFGPNSVDGLAEKSPVLPPATYTDLTDGVLTVTYTVKTDVDSGRPVLEWNSESELVNYVILTGGDTPGNRKSLVYHFGTPGAGGGAHLAPSNVLTGFQFCYGLTGGDVYQPTVKVATCYVPNSDGTGTTLPLDESDIVCPKPDEMDGKKRLMYSVDPDDPLGGIQVCTCNYDTEFQTCNPSLLAGTPGSCMPPADGDLDGDGNADIAVGLKYPPAAITIFQNGTGGCHISATGDYVCITNYDYCAYLPPGTPGC